MSLTVPNTANKEKELQQLRALLATDEVIERDSPDFVHNSQPFATQKDLKPTLVVRPKTLDSLSRTVRFLGSSGLDFKVRSAGFGSASAKDVILSMTAFDRFDFDQEKEELILGTGQTWEDYYRKMEETAPAYSVVSIRTPNLGIGGSTLCGGFSWLSQEFGCLSDPYNLLDIQVVKLDGTILWTSEDPDLDWALRGTEGAFAVAVAFKLRAFKYPEKVWSGPILMPDTPAMRKRICDGILGMDVPNPEPRVALFLYRMNPEILKAIGDGVNGNMIVVHAFDGRGEETGRKVFDWALGADGAIDRTSYQTRRELAMLQSGIGQMKYTQTCYWSAMALPKLTESVIMNAFDWYERTQTEAGGALAPFSSMLFELFCSSDSKSGRNASGWPRPLGFQHMVLIQSGALESGPLDNLSKKLVIDGAEDILGKGVKLDITANALEDFHDMRDVYAEHYDRLVELKKKYDPKNKLKGPIKI